MERFFAAITIVHFAIASCWLFQATTQMMWPKPLQPWFGLSSDAFWGPCALLVVSFIIAARLRVWVASSACVVALPACAPMRYLVFCLRLPFVVFTVHDWLCFNAACKGSVTNRQQRFQRLFATTRSCTNATRVCADARVGTSPANDGAQVVFCEKQIFFVSSYSSNVRVSF